MSFGLNVLPIIMHTECVVDWVPSKCKQYIYMNMAKFDILWDAWEAIRGLSALTAIDSIP